VGEEVEINGRGKDAKRKKEWKLKKEKARSWRGGLGRTWRAL
jgi:hypothetical protein